MNETKTQNHNFLFQPKVSASFFLIFLLATSSLSSCKKNNMPPQSKFLLNTACSINLYADGSKALYDEIFARIEQIERDFSAHIDSSFVSQINAAAGKNAIPVPPDVFFVISAALDYARMTDGLFDPTVGPLVSVWGINTDANRVPSDEEIASALQLINWRDVELVSATPLTGTTDFAGSVFLKKEGMRLDLGGIAKGYAADEVFAILKKHEVKQAIIDLGGNIFVAGKKQDGSNWKVGVKNPENPDSDTALVISAAENKAVVTSGVYERFFIQDDVRYHHILDTRTGRPADTNLLSTTIICDSSMTADALSTSVFLLGKDGGIELLKSLQRSQNVSGIFIEENGNATATENLRGNLSPSQNFAAEIMFE